MTQLLITTTLLAVVLSMAYAGKSALENVSENISQENDEEGETQQNLQDNNVMDLLYEVMDDRMNEMERSGGPPRRRYGPGFNPEFWDKEPEDSCCEMVRNFGIKNGEHFGTLEHIGGRPFKKKWRRAKCNLDLGVRSGTCHKRCTSLGDCPVGRSCVKGYCDGDNIILDHQRDNKKCLNKGSNRVFDLRGGAASLLNCRRECTKKTRCIAFSLHSQQKWCIGCSVELTDNHNGAIAFRKTVGN